MLEATNKDICLVEKQLEDAQRVQEECSKQSSVLHENLKESLGKVEGLEKELVVWKEKANDVKVLAEKVF